MRRWFVSASLAACLLACPGDGDDTGGDTGSSDDTNDPLCDGDHGDMTTPPPAHPCPELTPLCGRLAVVNRPQDDACHPCDADFADQDVGTFWCPKRAATCIREGSQAGACM